MAPFELHWAVWNDDVAALQRLLRAPGRPEDPHAPGGVDEWDNHGNAPLHLAIILNRPRCVRALVDIGRADLRLLSRDGWSPTAEAVSLGNRDLLRFVLQRRNERARDKVALSLPTTFERLEALPNFRVEMEWRFRSWIPFVARLAPSDTTVLYKYKSAVRLDTTIAGFSGMRFQRGKTSFVAPGRLFAQGVNASVFAGMPISALKGFLTENNVRLAGLLERSDLEAAAVATLSDLVADMPPIPDDRLLVLALNYQNERFAIVASENDDEPEHLETLTNVHLGAERRITSLVGENLRVRPARTGVWLFQSARSQVVDGYATTAYELSGITLEAKSRTEHLIARKAMAPGSSRGGSAGTLGAHPAPARPIADGSGHGSDDDDVFYDAETGLDPVPPPPPPPTTTDVAGETPALPTMESARQMLADMTAYKADLPPPAPPALSPAAYFDTTQPDQSCHPPGMGRPIVQSSRTFTFRAKVWLVDEYPLSREQLLDVLRSLRGASSIADKVIDFLELDLPAGFPIRMEITLFAGITLVVEFRNFQTAPTPPLSAVLFTTQGFAQA